MNIQLKQLLLLNFKGAKELGVGFTNVTDIFGDNGTYKSTLFDAFTWLLFGKDSHDLKDFNVKTLDSNGKAIPMLEHSVEGILNVDGQIMTLKRLYQEKWTRRRGAEQSELTGHETLYYWNDVPLQANEFKTKVDTLVSEGLFKLLTSSLYFNSLKWQDRRRALVLIAGEIAPADIYASMKKAHVAEILAILNSGKDLAEFRKEVAMRKKKLTDDLNAIPVRVDECTKGIPDELDFDQISRSIASVETTIKDIEAAITDAVGTYKEQRDKLLAIQTEIFALKTQRLTLENKENEAINKANNERSAKISDLKQKYEAAKNRHQGTYLDYDAATRRITHLEKDLELLREDWSRISSEYAVFDIDVDAICPTCKRELDPDIIIADLNRSFKEQQTDKLDKINEEGVSIKKRIADAYQGTAVMDASMKETQELAETLEKDIILVTAIPVKEIPNFSNTQWHSDLTKQINILELKLLEAPKIDTTALEGHRNEYQTELSSLRLQLATRDIRQKGASRIDELMTEEKCLAQQISDLEKKEFAMEAYSRATMDLVETNVNSKFTIVKFRMFNNLINGGTEEACECLVGGVPYADVNSAGKIQAGIDIINTLSDHYNTFCPIWVDNRESTNVIPPTKSQVINLIVSHDKSLKILAHGGAN